MRRAGIGHAAYIIDVLRDAVFPVGLCHDPSVAVTHVLYALALITGGGVAVVGPEKGADLLLLTGGQQNLNSIGGQLYDLPGAQFPDHLIAQLLSGVVLKGGTEGILFFLNDNGKPAHFVPGGNQVPVFPENQDGGGAVHHFLGKPDALSKGAFLINEGGNQLVGIDFSAGHAFKVSAAEGQILLDEGLGVVDKTNGADGVTAQIGTDENGLGISVRNAADGGGAGHFFQNPLEFSPEGRIFNVVYFPLEALFRVIGSHAAPAGSQMGMIVRAEKHIQHAVFAGSCSKKTTHGVSSFVSGPVPGGDRRIRLTGNGLPLGLCACGIPVCQLRLQGGIFGKHLFRVCFPLPVQLFGKPGVLHGEDLGSK